MIKKCSDEKKYVFAPVAIITLNRVEHLQKCLNTLESNKYASQTDVFISVDYPPDKKYIKGYNAIKEYLDTRSFKFKNVFIYYQSVNLGPNENISFITNEIKKSGYKNLIFSEDDNEFAPTFLEFMNWGLMVTRNIKSVTSISGYSLPIRWISNDPYVLVNNNYSAWGCAYWLDKKEMMDNLIKNGYLSEKIKFPISWFFIFTRRTAFLFTLLKFYLNKYLVLGQNGEFNVCDISLTLLMMLNNYFQLMPKKTLVFNNGFDGSGLNCDSDDFLQQELDLRTDWPISDVMNLRFRFSSVQVNLYASFDRLKSFFRFIEKLTKKG